MNTDPTVDDYSRAVDVFIETFFGPVNPVWSDRDPNSVIGRRLAPYLQVLRHGSGVPIVLPRQNPQTRQWVAYVIPRDARHAGAVSELLQAFVGPTYARFDGLPTQLADEDPIDQAVVRFAGHRLIFVIESPRAVEKKMWDALRLMQQTLAVRPNRSWHAPVPVGRLLAQFEIALASGANTASAAILDQLTATGGLNATNLSHLRIKRLAKLGRSSEMLRLPDLVDVATTRPPVPVRDAILGAVYATALAEPLSTGDLETARTRLIEAGTMVPALMEGPLTDLSPQALTVLAMAAWIADSTPIGESLRQSPEMLAAVEQLAPDLAAHYREPAPTVESDGLPDGDQPESADTPAAPKSWLECITRLAEHDANREIIDQELWRSWARAADADNDIAAALQQLDDEAAGRAWRLVGAFVDSDQYRRPAAKTAREFLSNALTHNRFSPGDLAGIVALAEIFLRASPDAETYARLLDDLAAEATRWVGPDRATVVLDLADLLASASCPDEEARLRLAYQLLRPLSDHPKRLDADQLTFAARLSTELGATLTWPQQDDQRTANLLPDVPAQDLLLYSLDEKVLDRVRAELQLQAPQVRVTVSHDHVGSRQLKQWTRRADAIVMATRCATHAATGFIRAHCRPDAIVREADGSGSASLLRAATIAMTRR
ncbi:protein DpdD [Micromonospora aurantiaca (nom. illeg.)]|uniref:protein DpdD n=1 Tax=Micromonospora aurantiaca (nom. illeg.) TaxID=47850 RepID=UPI00378DC3CE